MFIVLDHPSLDCKDSSHWLRRNALTSDMVILVEQQHL